MFLIPFIYKKIETIYPYHLFYIFLNRGTLFLQLDKSEIDSFCDNNEIYYSNKTIEKENCYIEIDTSRTNIRDFYSYYENSEAECWRKFILVGNYDEDFLHINETNPEFIQETLKSIIRFKTNL
jgi:hypothetical protein